MPLIGSFNLTSVKARRSKIPPVTSFSGFIAVGGGQVRVSTDGLTWEGRTVGAAMTHKSIAYGNGVWITSGNSGRMNISTDTITWTALTSPTGSEIISITYGNGVFVGVTNVYNTSVAVRSSNNGSSWTTHGLSITSSQPQCIAHGNGVYVVGGTVGFSGAVQVRRSTDGITWTAPSSGIITNAGNFNPARAFYGGTTLFITGGANTINASTDGITWGLRSSPHSDANYYAGFYGNNTYVVAGGNGRLATSTDSITWTNRVSNVATGTWIWCGAAGNGVFLVGGQGGLLRRSTDGITWTSVDAGFAGTEIRDMIFT